VGLSLKPERVSLCKRRYLGAETLKKSLRKRAICPGRRDDQKGGRIRWSKEEEKRRKYLSGEK